MLNNYPNVKDAVEFIKVMYKPDNLDNFELIDSAGEVTECQEFEDLVGEMIKANLQGENIVVDNGNGYFIDSSYKRNPFQKSRIAHIDSPYIPYICIGIKYRGIQGKETDKAREDAINIAGALSLRPTAIVDTGVSIQLYWKMFGYHGFSYPYWDLEESHFKSDQEFCAQVDAIWWIVNNGAYDVGLELEDTEVHVCYEREICTLDMYAMLPGFVHHFYNRETGDTDQFVVKILENNATVYTYQQITTWIKTWASGDGEEREVAIEEFIEAFFELRVLYFNLITIAPELWKAPYRRVGRKTYADKDATLRCLEKVEDIEDECA